MTPSAYRTCSTCRLPAGKGCSNSASGRDNSSQASQSARSSTTVAATRGIRDDHERRLVRALRARAARTAVSFVVIGGALVLLPMRPRRQGGAPGEMSSERRRPARAMTFSRFQSCLTEAQVTATPGQRIFQTGFRFSANALAPSSPSSVSATSLSKALA